MDLVVAVYKLTDTYPPTETYGLAAHTRKTAVSVPSNIAEGYRRGSEKEYRKFLLIAFGSAAELETQVDLAQRMGFGDTESHTTVSGLLNEVLPMLNKMSSNI